MLDYINGGLNRLQWWGGKVKEGTCTVWSSNFLRWDKTVEEGNWVWFMLFLWVWQFLTFFVVGGLMQLRPYNSSKWGAKQQMQKGQIQPDAILMGNKQHFWNRLMPTIRLKFFINLIASTLVVYFIIPGQIIKPLLNVHVTWFNSYRSLGFKYGFIRAWNDFYTT